MNTLRRLILASLLVLILCPVASYAKTEEVTMLTQAKEQYQSGNYYFASTWLERLLKEYPATPRRQEVLLLLSKSYASTGRDAKAATALRALLKDFPKAAETLDPKLLKLVDLGDPSHTEYSLADVQDAPVEPAKTPAPLVASPVTPKPASLNAAKPLADNAAPQVAAPSSIPQTAPVAAVPVAVTAAKAAAQSLDSPPGKVVAAAPSALATAPVPAPEKKKWWIFPAANRSAPAQPKPAEPKPAEQRYSLDDLNGPDPAEVKSVTPNSTDPKLAAPKPAVTKAAEPKTAGPQLAAPKPVDSKLATTKPVDPKNTEPKQSGPKAAEVKPAEPEPAPQRYTLDDLNDPAPAEAKPVTPNPTDPKLAAPKLADPEAAVPKLIEPKLIEPKLIEPKLIEPKLIEPKLIEPKAAVPKPVSPVVKAAAPRTAVATAAPAAPQSRQKISEMATLPPVAAAPQFPQPAVAGNPEHSADTSCYTLQIGEYVVQSGLGDAKKKIKSLGLEPLVEPGAKKKGPMTRLYLGEYPSQAAAKKGLDKLRAGKVDGFYLLEEDQKYHVYAGSYLDEKGAAKERQRFAALGIKLSLKQVVVAVPTFQLTAGNFPTREAALAMAGELEKQGVSSRVIERCVLGKRPAVPVQ